MFSFSGHIKPSLRNQPIVKKKKYGEKKNMSFLESLNWKGVAVVKEHLPSCSIMKASEAGLEDEVIMSTACDCAGHEEESPNIVLNTGIFSIIEKLTDINNENDSDGFCTHIEIGMSDTAPLASQTALIKPKSRKAIAQAFRDSTNAVFKVFFNGTQANSSQSSVTIGTSKTQFSIVGGSGSLFSIGELIEVGLPSAEIVEITNLVGDIVTVDPPLSTTPSGGETVKQAYQELGLFGGSSATDTIGTGVAFARTTSFTARTKDQGFGLTIEWRISIT